MGLMRLTYFSTFKNDPETNIKLCQLTEILETARRNNSMKEITGALIFDSNWFVQILEGERDAVWSTFQRIQQDRRHSGVTLIEMVHASSRCFGNWWMAITERNAANSRHFAPFMVDGLFDPSNMLPEQILSLMINLTSESSDRELSIAGIDMAARFMRERAKPDEKRVASR